MTSIGECFWLSESSVGDSSTSTSRPALLARLPLLLAASVLFAVFVTLVALLAEELSFRRYRGLPDLLRAVWAAVEENFGYRQANAFWRLGGLVEVLRGTTAEWGEMRRKGFDGG